MITFSPRSFSYLIAAAFLLFFAGSYAMGWAPPASAPPAGNVSAPLNVSNTGQTKSGGVILNTGGATYGLIVDQGKVGIGTTSPGEKLDVVGGNIKSDTGFCIGSTCITSWPAGGGEPAKGTPVAHWRTSVQRCGISDIRKYWSGANCTGSVVAVQDEDLGATFWNLAGTMIVTNIPYGSYYQPDSDCRRTCKNTPGTFLKPLCASEYQFVKIAGSSYIPTIDWSTTWFNYAWCVKE